jgi:hypothetical protein
MFLEFGSTPEKQQAKRELHLIAYGAQQQPLSATADAEESDESTEASSDSVEQYVWFKLYVMIPVSFMFFWLNFMYHYLHIIVQKLADISLLT